MIVLIGKRYIIGIIRRFSGRYIVIKMGFPGVDDIHDHAVALAVSDITFSGRIPHCGNDREA